MIYLVCSGYGNPEPVCAFLSKTEALQYITVTLQSVILENKFSSTYYWLPTKSRCLGDALSIKEIELKNLGDV